MYTNRQLQHVCDLKTLHPRMKWRQIKRETKVGKSTCRRTWACWVSFGRLRPHVGKTRKLRSDRVLKKRHLRYLIKDVAFESQLFADERADRMYKDILRAEGGGRPSIAVLYRALKVLCVKEFSGKLCQIQMITKVCLGARRRAKSQTKCCVHSPEKSSPRMWPISPTKLRATRKNGSCLATRRIRTPPRAIDAKAGPRRASAPRRRASSSARAQKYT